MNKMKIILALAVFASVSVFFVQMTNANARCRGACG